MLIDGTEPMYATVKRTARNPRTGGVEGCHLYQYPCTINGTTGLVTITAADSCCETDSCLSLTPASGSNGVVGTNGGTSTAFLRLHDGGQSDHLLQHHNPYHHCIDG